MNNVKQMILEIHTPRFNSENREMSLTDYAQVHYSLRSLKDKLDFSNILYLTGNDCCGRFTMFIPKGIADRRLCCYEIYYVNNRFFK